MLIHFIVQKLMPDFRCYNKDHLKDILAERVTLLDLKDVKSIQVPLFDELAIDKLMEKIKAINTITICLPRSFIEKKTKINRYFFFRVFATQEPELLNELIKNAHK